LLAGLCPLAKLRPGWAFGKKRRGGGKKEMEMGAWEERGGKLYQPMSPQFVIRSCLCNSPTID